MANCDIVKVVTIYLLIEFSVYLIHMDETSWLDHQTQSQSDPDWAGRLPELAILGIQLFNQGRYFEAHEELEAAWRAEERPIRDLYRGILQVAVGYLHVRNKNYLGAKKVLQRSQRWLALYPDVCQGVQVEQLRKDSMAVYQAIRLDDKGLEIDPRLLKPVRFD